jgi:hypothetical protein
MLPSLSQTIEPHANGQGLALLEDLRLLLDSPREVSDRGV